MTDDGRDGHAKEEEAEEEGEVRLLDEMAVLDFDMLCATVASRSQGFSVERRSNGDEEGDEVGGVQRLWEGGVFDCFDDRRIAIEATCCPCYRFGKNVERANLGPCFLQGTVHIILVVAALTCFILFGVTLQLWFLYIGGALFLTLGTYLGYFRTRIRKLFNIRGSSGSIDDCMHHLLCSCCSLCQEARTLEINNVQGGMWRGRGDTICIGNYGDGSKNFPAFLQAQGQIIKSPGLHTMQRENVADDHKWSMNSSHVEPLVSTTK